MNDRHGKRPARSGKNGDSTSQIPVAGNEEIMNSGSEPEEGDTVVLPVQEYEELRAQMEELKDRYLRVAADFDNYRKRVEKEKEDIVCYANERLISDLLPVLDNLERALANDFEGAEVENILDGVRMVSQQLQSVLTGCGLEPVKAVGSAFDPRFHEAMRQIPSSEHSPNTIIEVYQRGYLLKGRLLRPALVAIAGPSAAE